MKSNVKEDCLIIVFIIERSPHFLQNLQKQFTLLAVGKKRFCWNVNEHQFRYHVSCCNCLNFTVLSKEILFRNKVTKTIQKTNKQKTVPGTNTNA